MAPTERHPLTIAVAQPVSVLHDVGFNVERHAETVRVASARVVVFPELSLTGYSMDGPVLDLGDERLLPLVAACASADSLALVGAPVAGPDGGNNIAILAVTGDGVAVAYRKMYLGGNEPSTFRPGSGPAALNVDGWRLGLAVCKDTGVAAHAKAAAALGIDVYAAGVCETEADRHVPTERAARITAEHRVWVAMASFAGPTGGGFDHTAGRSTIWRPDGSIAATVDEASGRVAKATVPPPTPEASPNNG